jgi:hypothetical protein
VLSQALMETEVAGLIGADRHERTPERTGHPNGYRMRTWDTRVGTIELAIPKVRPGTVLPVVTAATPAAPNTRCWPSCKRRPCMACRPGRLTS